ncbi:hypothetical protein [Acidithiobacillus caldus]|uniref:hypothetical protein n=1 Tax=Acidithiobacillus caldus TaxID=33059 RepID=UPI0007DA2110|nr:hypothetical protein [Acidithiobacillus caldus]
MSISDVLNVRSEAVYARGDDGEIAFAKITYPARPFPRRVIGWFCIVPVVFCVEDEVGPLFHATAAIVNLTTGDEILMRTIEDAVRCETLEEAHDEALLAADFIAEQVDLAEMKVREVFTADGPEEHRYIRLDFMSNPMAFFVDH